MSRLQSPWKTMVPAMLPRDEAVTCTYASHLLRQGVNPKVVQERLGHSTPAFTLAIYSHVLPGMQNEVARRVEESLLEQKPDAGIRRDLQNGQSASRTPSGNT
jgi:Phage integrase family